MVPPGLSRPSASAAPIIARAGRSLMEPDGLALSSFRNSRHGATVKLRDFNEWRFAYEVEHRGHQTRYSISLPQQYPYFTALSYSAACHYWGATNVVRSAFYRASPHLGAT